MPRQARFTSRAASVALALIAGLGLAAAPAAALDPRFDPKSVTTPPLHAIPKVTPERTVLKNGMVVYLLEDHSLPIVSGVVYFRASTAWAPADKVGLGELTATVMRTGGSAAKTGDWMDDRLGAIGASVSSSMSADLASASFRSLTENASEVLGLVAEVLRRPAFPDDKIELAKVSLRRQIASRNDEMIPLLSRVAAQAVYGKDSPWARTTEYATVEAITRDDCVKMHGLAYAPERAIVVVVGDFKSADMKKRITTLFGDWKKSGAAPPAMPAMPAKTTPRLVFAPKNDVTQSGVLLAHLGFKADDPDLPDMDVVEQALGGGFQSRLFNRIRTQRGLAYSAGATAGGGFFKPGVFVARALTRNDSVMVTLDLLREEVARIVREPLGDDEARTARESVENALVFEFERPSQVAFRAAFYELGGYPADFLQRYQKALAATTPASMLAAAKRKIRPDEAVAVIVGKEKEFDRPLESAGLPVERVDVTIPPPPSKLKVVPVSPEAVTRGRQWLTRAAEAAGGAAAFAGVKSWSEEKSATLTMQGQSVAVGSATSWRLPDHLLTVQKLPMGEMSQGYDGKKGWRKGFGRLAEQPDVAQSVSEDLERSLIRLFADPSRLNVQAMTDTRTLDGVECKVAVVKSEIISDWQLFFAPDGHLAGMSYLDKGPSGEATFVATYDDWRDVGGFKYPFSEKLSVDGQPFVDSKLQSVKVNPALSDSLFAMPSQ